MEEPLQRLIRDVNVRDVIEILGKVALLPEHGCAAKASNLIGVLVAAGLADLQELFDELAGQVMAGAQLFDAVLESTGSEKDYLSAAMAVIILAETHILVARLPRVVRIRVGFPIILVCEELNHGWLGGQVLSELGEAAWPAWLLLMLWSCLCAHTFCCVYLLTVMDGTDIGKLQAFRLNYYTTL